MELQTIKESDIKPLVLVIDDREAARQVGVDYFHNFDCDVVSASESKEAMKRYLNSPQIDLIFTDIDLVGDVHHKDKSGVQIARFIREIDPGLPIFGHSTKFEANELSSEEQSYFSGYYDKGGAVEIMEMFLEMKEIASKHRKNRLHKLFEKLQQIRKKGIIDSETYHEVVNNPQLIKHIDLPQFESALKDTCYHLKLIEPCMGKNVKPLLVWLREENTNVEVEVFGYPDLYSYGDNETSAVDNLLSLIEGYSLDFKEDDESKFAGPALQIKRYIESVWE